MARRDALLQLHKSLLSRRTDIRKKLADELDGLRSLQGDDPTGDLADAAFELGSEEMASQLAELDARELHQIERAFVHLSQGTYGICEGCECKIPVGRLNALPYTTMCIACQRQMEKYPDWTDGRSGGNGEEVHDASLSSEEQGEADFSAISIRLSSSR
jgi:DnaK suppressor protein